MVAALLVTDDRHGSTERFIRARGWSGVRPEEVWDMPEVFIGSVQQLADDMHARREQLGFSYVVVSTAAMMVAAPIVARLAGT